ncbi:unnamed protein product [Leptidea sinapis]|uniref:THAP-type domain-containing protein n=1 Tax=Leptidea sinapis TaxID=189913 RepID=A0A5E4QXN0_9NEOP|nr:unnamed protein product [Leptidea sinapis]
MFARCKQWVKFTGKEDLVYVPIEKLHQLKQVCGRHFLTTDFNRKKTQLRRSAVPSVELTRTPLADELFIDFPLHIFRSELMVLASAGMEHNYCGSFYSPQS